MSPGARRRGRRRHRLRRPRRTRRGSRPGTFVRLVERRVGRRQALAERTRRVARRRLRHPRPGHHPGGPRRGGLAPRQAAVGAPRAVVHRPTRPIRAGRRRRGDATQRRRSRALGGDEERRDVALGGPGGRSGRRESRVEARARGPGGHLGCRIRGWKETFKRRRRRFVLCLGRRRLEPRPRAGARGRRPRLPRLGLDGRIPGPRRLRPARVRVYAADPGRFLGRRRAPREFVHGARGGARAPGHRRRGDEPPLRVRRGGRVARG
mmetsp:Transcript_12531/g.50379  ORF Transcript_12531/g.50379 Transcript_12531/m.50379 type:complete len:265 (+) Transcript_12531:302-1096(+)